MKKYFYSNGKEKYGPYSEDELLTKQLSLETLIWYEGLDEWMSLSNLPELREKFFKSPPPLPDIENKDIEDYPNNNKKYYFFIGIVIMLVSVFYFYTKKDNLIDESIKEESIEIENNSGVNSNVELDEVKKISNTEAVEISTRKFNSYSPKIENSHGGIISFSKDYIGDLNSDGLDDVVIFFALTPAEGGNANVGRGLVVYINNGNDMKSYAGFEPDYPFNMVEIKDNKIHIIEEKYAPDDYPNYPSIKNHRYFVLDGKNLKEI
jgi:hypothetical protein